MEQVKISYINHYHNDDFDELNLRINDCPSRPAVSYVVDDEHNFFLQVDAESQQVIGATILYADDWFAEIAAALQSGDLDHPDVRFFIEQKIKSFAEQWTAQHPPESANSAGDGSPGSAHSDEPTQVETND